MSRLHPSPRRQSACVWLGCAIAVIVSVAGCGTTRWSDSKCTATEQLLISDAVERAVMQIDMRPLAGQAVFLDTTMLDDVQDGKYLTSALRHQILASGCRLAANRDTAAVVVEARAGAIGTDRNELLLGIPATSVQVAGNGTSIPEMAIFKRTDQRGVAEVNLFAYERASGRPLWQSGIARINSNTRDRWMFGTGPFQDGDIYDRVEFAGERIRSPWKRKEQGDDAGTAVASAQTDLRNAKTFATLTPPDGPDPDRPLVADDRPADLPAVR